MIFQHGRCMCLFFHHIPCFLVCWYPAWNSAFSIFHKSVVLCMVSALHFSDTYMLLHFHIRNQLLHPDNGSPVFSIVFKKGSSVQTSFQSWKISVATIYSLSTVSCTWYPGFKCAFLIWSSFIPESSLYASVLLRTDWFSVNPAFWFQK